MKEKFSEFLFMAFLYFICTISLPFQGIIKAQERKERSKEFDEYLEWWIREAPVGSYLTLGTIVNKLCLDKNKE